MLSNPPTLPNHKVYDFVGKHRFKNKSYFNIPKLKYKLITILN